MIFQDCAVTTMLKSEIFNYFYRQKFVFKSYYGSEAKKLISLLFLADCFGFLGLLFLQLKWKSCGYQVMANCKKKAKTDIPI